jgi:hypothetical protein
MHRRQHRGHLGIVDHARLLVVVDDFYVLGPAVLPTKAHSELAVDPDRILSRPIANDGLEAIGRRDTWTLELDGCLERRELASREPEQVSRKPFRGISR